MSIIPLGYLPSTAKRPATDDVDPLGNPGPDSLQADAVELGAQRLPERHRLVHEGIRQLETGGYTGRLLADA
ncbi:hypothetical protein MesoLjLc_49440 [Mesorhizobium sp. L-8-10]|uniref:hypothetical protein n=1 Tax=Mesorhizobium sp. L-8-10 TaxID=2744523 RepID=UPI001925B77B|nr:hypothetical protein [Mesorhizobium sp. L-8-10]BCH33014.1 hypothetical protein MesoLjLc_49440 [Mesorhizobium sp. L-8-10]